MSEAENILQTIRSAIQDFVAPELREIKVRLDSIEKQQEMQFRALLSAIRESKAEAELSTVKMISTLSERVAVLESKQQ